MNISDIHKRHIAANNTALSFHGQKTSYAELEKNIEQYARYFFSIGVQAGDRVAIALPNCPEFIYTYLGIIRSGGVALPLNLLQAPQELLFIIQDSGARFFVTNPVIGQQLKPLSQLPIKIIVLDEQCQSDIKSAPAAAFPVTGDDDTCTFLYTSGTTGRPKAAMLTHNNLLGNVISMDEASHFKASDNFLAVLPMFHSFGWTAVVMLSLHIGCTITILEAFRPKEIMQVLATEGITIFCGVPSMYAVLIKIGRKGAFPTLRFPISGGDSISEEHMRAFEEIYGIPIIEGYGLSEASPVVTLNPLYGGHKIKSIGLPLPGVEVKVVNDDGQELPANEIGELIAKGPNIMKGYYHREEETKTALRDGWLYTGDLAYIDEDGFVFIAGRKKELIISAGFNIYPREVEEAICAHPSVKEAAVIGVPHTLKGEVVKAFVVLEEGCALDKNELFSFLKTRLANYKIPEEYVFTGDLPRGLGGKILKRMLK